MYVYNYSIHGWSECGHVVSFCPSAPIAQAERCNLGHQGLEKGQKNLRWQTGAVAAVFGLHMICHLFDFCVVGVANALSLASARGKEDF